MKIANFKKLLAPFLVVSLLTLTSCAQEPPSRYEGAQTESTQGSQRNQTVSKEATQGSNFNKFFPAGDSEYERVFTQEKLGFAAAKLKEDGKEVAKLSISDTTGNDSARNKFQQSSEKIGGYPAVNQGSKTTAILVADRYQVKVTSSDPDFSEEDREEWLEKFDLNGLANLR